MEIKMTVMMCAAAAGSGRKCPEATGSGTYEVAGVDFGVSQRRRRRNVTFSPPSPSPPPPSAPPPTYPASNPASTDWNEENSGVFRHRSLCAECSWWNQRSGAHPSLWKWQRCFSLSLLLLLLLLLPFFLSFFLHYSYLFAGLSA